MENATRRRGTTKRIAKIVNILTIFGLFATFTLFAQSPSSSSFQVQSGSLTPGSNHATSSSFDLQGCLDPGLAAGSASSASFSTQVGCGTTFSSVAGGDDDGDGVPNGVEDGAPNGGDGNNDGTPDSVQSNVTSFPTSNGYVTVVTTNAACGQIEHVAAVSESSLGDDPHYNYPIGLFDVTVGCTSPGLTTSVRMIFHGVVAADWPPSAYRWFNGQYASLAGVTYGTVTIPGEGTVPTATLSLVDGGNGDDDATAGTIHNLAGPAALIPSPVPASSPLGLMILALLLAIATIVRLRWS